MLPNPTPPISVHHLEGNEPLPQRLIFWTLQPLLITLVLGAFLVDPSNDQITLLTIVGVQLLLGGLEYYMPARPAWRQTVRQKLLLIMFGVVTLVAAETAAKFHERLLAERLSDLRSALNLDVWPHQAPLIVQVLLVFFASEFLTYWIHRAEHRWSIVWRVSGHGAHHSFKKLNSINSAANHPIELLWLVLPTLMVDLFFGVGTATLGALLLTSVQVAVVHSNLRLNAKWIGLVLTTNAWHFRHHSADLAESNTNFGCAAIVWDRVFKTFGDSGVVEAGIGPLEPTTLEKLLMPLREPRGSVIAPNTPR